MGTWFFTPNPVTNYEEAARSDTATFGRFHNAMLNQGISLPPSQFEAAFLSTAHGQPEIEATPSPPPAKPSNPFRRSTH